MSQHLRLVYTSHPNWPLPRSPAPPSTSSSSLHPDPASASGSPAPEGNIGAPSPPILRLTVLDSSFNPPHAAHLALATAPTRTTASDHGSSSSSSSSLLVPHSDATLLLLGTSNVDKGSIQQHELEVRSEMMREMAIELERRYPPAPLGDEVPREQGNDSTADESGTRRDGRGNVGVMQWTGSGGRFVDKSRLIKHKLSKTLPTNCAAQVRLVFPMGECLRISLSAVQRTLSSAQGADG